MGKIVDMIGRRCGRLTVIARGPDYIDEKTGYHRAQWWCKCSCGNTSLVEGRNLRKGNTKSCGCLMSEKCSEAGRMHKGENKFVFLGNIVMGQTMQGDKFFFDAEDYNEVAKFYWLRHKSGYFYSHDDSGKQIALHRLVMKALPNERIDHINHQKENACKANLRRVTQSENGFNAGRSKNNTSGRTGVNFNKNRNKWIARLMKDGISYFLGSFDSFEEAVEARKAAEDKYFGQYSYENSMAASPVIEVA